MDILNTLSLKSNRQIKINFNGGDLSSDAGLLLIKEFAAKIGFAKLIKKIFKIDDKSIRFHKDNEKPYCRCSIRLSPHILKMTALMS